MEVDSSVRRTFLPQSGAIARSHGRDFALGAKGQFAAAKQPASPTRCMMSPASKLAAARETSAARVPSGLRTQVPQQLSQSHSQPSFEPSFGSKLENRRPPGSNEMMKSSSLPSLLPREAPSKGLRQCHEPGSLLGRSASNASKTLGDLIAAAQRNVNVHELPSKDVQESKEALQKFPEKQGKASSGAPKNNDRRQVNVTEGKPRTWTMKEESNRLTEELTRLGARPEPMLWASEEIENKWLRRQATYEMFKALVTSDGTQDNGSCGMPCEGSTRAPTPQSSTCTSGLACEQDALSSLLTKDSFRRSD